MPKRARQNWAETARSNSERLAEMVVDRPTESVGQAMARLVAEVAPESPTEPLAPGTRVVDTRGVAFVVLMQIADIVLLSCFDRRLCEVAFRQSLPPAGIDGHEMGADQLCPIAPRTLERLLDPNAKVARRLAGRLARALSVAGVKEIERELARGVDVAPAVAAVVALERELALEATVETTGRPGSTEPVKRPEQIRPSPTKRAKAAPTPVPTPVPTPMPAPGPAPVPTTALDQLARVCGSGTARPPPTPPPTPPSTPPPPASREADLRRCIRQLVSREYAMAREMARVREINAGLADCYSQLLKRMNQMTSRATRVVAIPTSAVPKAELVGAHVLYLPPPAPLAS